MEWTEPEKASERICSEMRKKLVDVKKR